MRHDPIDWAGILGRGPGGIAHARSSAMERIPLPAMLPGIAALPAARAGSQTGGLRDVVHW